MNDGEVIRRLSEILSKEFGGEIRNPGGHASHQLFEAAGIKEYEGRGLLKRAEQMGLMEREIHGSKTLLIREPRKGFERREPRDLIPPSPASIAAYHLHRCWAILKLQNDRVLGDSESFLSDVALYLISYRWLVLAVRLARETVEGGSDALETARIERSLLAINMRNVVEHFDDYERGEGRRGPSAFPFIAEGYVQTEGHVAILINEERIELPAATDAGRELYERADEFLAHVLEEEHRVREME